LPELTDVASDQQSTGRVMKIEINRQLAQQLGINPSLVDSILYDAFGQRVAARIYTRLNQYFVILHGTVRARQRRGHQRRPGPVARRISLAHQLTSPAKNG
jgi:multidrug efflux pump subunit AcrB